MRVVVATLLACLQFAQALPPVTPPKLGMVPPPDLKELKEKLAGLKLDGLKDIKNKPSLLSSDKLPKLPKLDLPKLNLDAARLKGLKGLENDIKKKGLPPLGGKMGGAPKGPLQYDLAKFTEVYGRPGHPTEHPTHDPNHAEFDPFEIPMPTLKAEFPPETAFKKMDTDADGLIKGKEFRGISESGMFHVVTPDQMKQYAVFGMQKELFLKMHGDEITAAGLVVADLFDEHDEDDNDRLTREEYDAAIKKFKKEL